MQTAKPEQIGFSSTRLNRISQMLQGYVDRAELAGMSATVARCGQTAYHETFGWSDVEAQVPMQFDTIDAASMTGSCEGVYDGMSVYLVTGGAGFIGSHIVEELVQRGECVRVLDNYTLAITKN